MQITSPKRGVFRSGHYSANTLPFLAALLGIHGNAYHHIHPGFLFCGVGEEIREPLQLSERPLRSSIGLALNEVYFHDGRAGVYGSVPQVAVLLRSEDPSAAPHILQRISKQFVLRPRVGEGILSVNNCPLPPASLPCPHLWNVLRSVLSWIGMSLPISCASNLRVVCLWSFDTS